MLCGKVVARVEELLCASKPGKSTIFLNIDVLLLVF